MNISKYNKADVLRILYNNSKPQGMGFLHFDPIDMTKKQAQDLLDDLGPLKYFDYLKGRVMKIDLSNDELDTRLYNRDNGIDAAEKAIVSFLGE